MDAKLRKIMAEALEIEEKGISEKSSMQSIENWDSLSHMRLVVSLEEAYDTKFNENDIIRLTSYKGILEVLKEKGV